jgi:peptide/nickel transport system substrate-binding protein
MPDYPFDQQRANQLLDEAGFRRGADGTRFAIKLLSAPFGEDIPLWSTYIQQSLQQVGVRAVVEKPDSASFLTQVYRDWNFDVSTSWHVYRSDPAISTMVWYRSGSPKGTISTNQWGWVNPAVDKMIDDAASTVDAGKRKGLYAEIVKYLNTDTPLWMAIDRQFVSVTSRRLHNHHNNPRWPSSHWADLWMDA